MATLRLVNSYKKATTVTDAHGLPVVDTVTGRPLIKVNTLFRYALVDATAKEIALYKKFRRQDGTDYYREGKLVSGETVPIYVSNQYHGNSVTINGYVRENGKIGFSIDSTETDTLQSLAEQFPAMAAALQGQIVASKLAGTKVELINEEAGADDDSKVGFDADTNRVTAEGEGEEGEGGEEHEE